MIDSRQQSIKETDKVYNTDVLVVGAGIGGCCSAITARENGGQEVVIVEKSHAGKTGPSALVGGVFGLVEGAQGIVEHQEYLTDQKILEQIVGLAPEVLSSLIKWGVNFIKTPDGKFSTVYQRRSNSLTLDGGGIPMMNALTGYAEKIGIKIVNWIMITDLLISNGKAVGAVGINCRTGEFAVFKSKTIIMSTGGTVFKSRQPGHRNTTGDGFAAAYRAGTEIAGFDYSSPNVYGAVLEVGPGNGLMLSLGARLLNNKMEEYVKKYPEIEKQREPSWHSPLMAMEAKIGNAPPVWLDLRHFTKEQISAIYRSVPYAAKRWEKLGFIKDGRFVKLCEYAPEGPRGNGGIFINSEMESRNIQNLFACGEAAPYFQTAAGLNRAAISGVLAGKSAAKRAFLTSLVEAPLEVVRELRSNTMAPLYREEGIDPENALISLQEAIHPYPVYILRNEKSMKKALEEVERIRDEVLPHLRAYDAHYLRLTHEIRNMVLCAEMLLKSALERKESRYGMLREDYPFVDNANWLKWIFLKKEDLTGSMKVWKEDVPIKKYELPPKKERFLHPFWQRVEELGYWKKTERA